MDYTTTAMVASVKRRITVPTAQPLFLPADIVAVLSEEMHNQVVPKLMSFREEYFVHSIDYTPATGVETIRIPGRAIGGKLRDVAQVASDGAVGGMTRLNADQIKMHGGPGYHIRNDEVVLLAMDGKTIRLSYFRRPNTLVISSQAGQVTAINDATNEVTLSNAPTTWTTATLFDAIQGEPLFKSLGDDLVITAKSGPILTFEEIPADLAVGDWIAEAGYSPIAQVPYEAHNLIVLRAVISIATALKDTTGKKLAMADYSEALELVEHMVTPRVDSAGQKLTAAGGIFEHSGI